MQASNGTYDKDALKAMLVDLEGGLETLVNAGNTKFNGNYVFSVIKKENDELIGNCSFNDLDKIYGTAEICVLIGDEENRNKFLILKDALAENSEIEIVQMYYGNQLSQDSIYNFDKEYRPKLYKRLRNFVWQEPIHEAVRLDPVVYDSDIVIWHKPHGQHGSRDLTYF